MLCGINNEYYTPGVRRLMIMITKSIGVIFLINYFFYKTVWAFVFLLPVGFMYFRKEVREYRNQMVHEGREQFKELLLLSSTNMRAGYSVENALLGSVGDLSNLFGSECMVCRLLSKAAHQRANKKCLDEVFIDAGKVTGIDELIQFGRLYEIAYSRSGNLSEIMDKVASSIIDNMETENEIYLSLCERQFEMKIMNIMPIAIMFYINVTNNGYFDKMYHNLPGIIIMTVCLGVYIMSYYAGYRIMNIAV